MSSKINMKDKKDVFRFFFFLSFQLVTMITGVPTAVTDASARMELCVTLSLELVSALLDTEVGAVRCHVQ